MFHDRSITTSPISPPTRRTCACRSTAFIGGLDIAWGRWDNGAHLVADPGRRYFRAGVDYVSLSGFIVMLLLMLKFRLS